MNNKNPTITAIQDAVSAEWNIPVIDIMGQERFAPIVRARHVCFLFVRSLTSLRLTEIGEIFNRDHTSIMHGIGAIERAYALDPILRDRVARVAEALNSTATFEARYEIDEARRRANSITAAFQKAILTMATERPLDFLARVSAAFGEVGE